MKVIKDLDQGLLLYRYAKAGNFAFATTVLYCFDFNDPGKPLTEQQLWPLVTKELGKDAILDAGMPKVSGEILLRGKCYAPKGKTIPAAKVTAKVGSLSKSLAVFGNRTWVKRGGVQVPSEPEPFAEMDLTYAHAFGGKGYDQNPIGKGFIAEPDQAAEQNLSLPNVESPNSLIGSPADRREPSGFLPYDVMWPQRSKKLGTYDERWLKERWPYFPDDMDYSFFNVAPKDQWLTGATKFFKGDEGLEVDGMHPEKQALRSRLPGLRPRLFLVHQKKDGEVFGEFALDLDTVWLFPSIEKGLVLYRSIAPAADDEASDVIKLFLVAEKLTDQPKSFAFYKEEFQKRLDRKVPADIAAIKADADAKMADAKGKIAQAKADVAKIKDQLAKGEVPDIVKHAPKGDPAAALDTGGAQLGAAADKLAGLQDKLGPMGYVDTAPMREAQAKMAEAKGKIADAMARVDEGKAQAKQQLVDALAKNPEAAKNVDVEKLFNPPPPPPLDKIPTKDEILAQVEEAKQKALAQATEAMQQAGQDPKQLLDALNAPPPAGPPSFDFPGIPDDVKANLTPDQLRNVLEQEEKAKAMLADAKVKYEAAMAKAEQLKANPIPDWARERLKKAGIDVDDMQPLTRDEVVARYRAGKSLAGKKLAELDLSGLDLHGADLAGANLSKTNLSGANLSGANLTKAIAGEADFSRANLKGAKLPKALLMKAKLPQADLTGADLSKGVCSQADFTGAKMAGGTCEGTLFEKATLKGADVSKASASKGYFLTADLSGATFAGANLEKAVFMKSNVDQADFSKTRAKGAIFWEVSGERVKFGQSDLTNLRIGNSTLPGAEFKESTMPKASLMKTDFTGGNFQDCAMHRAMVDSCQLGRANLYHIKAVSAQFTKSDLSGANMVGANLFKASLRKAKLVNTDLRGSNLYAAETLRAEVRDTKLNDAILTMTKLKQQQREGQK
ncbi:MAG: DUF2169 domain-containing protein [Nitrospirota bacterium]|nr:DUF2169 domain-containing protein [Nitrospirota bacterium]